ncbi:MAG TPA: hypothetical protein PLL10_08845, partial [Elusimicrobiales bacterium]|nr:hypothetical protein [Elusimicrobiales bacterium]
VKQEMGSNPCVQQVAAAGAAADSLCVPGGNEWECVDAQNQAAEVNSTCVNHGWSTYTVDDGEGGVGFASLVPALQSACENEGGEYYYKPSYCDRRLIPDSTEEAVPPAAVSPGDTDMGAINTTIDGGGGYVAEP